VKTMFCGICGKPTLHANVSHAAVLVQVSRETIYAWLRKEWIHGIRLPSNRTVLCVESLWADRGTASHQSRITGMAIVS
jgi:predicted site-specific integrase-resolvase